MQPNVLFIMADQWPGKLLRAAGNRHILTPTLDQLARLGTRYARAYSESPICIPARRSVMTGTSPRKHGDRVFSPAMEMPPFTPIAQAFRDGGYQSYGVGKMHVYPQRDRIGFDDILLAEEGRPQLGAVDDYDIFLAEQGAAGEQFLHGMNNNHYMHRAWHLPERMHVTNWVTREAAKCIKRRNPKKPLFLHVSYTHPHPPLTPLNAYLNLYDPSSIASPLTADWARRPLPPALRQIQEYWHQEHEPHELLAIRRAFYALCTHIDHQIRVVLGTLREEQMLDNTIILFCSDHGDMLGDFGLWAKRLFYEASAQVPMLLIGPKNNAQVPQNHVDNRLVGLQDVMPTLLSLSGLPIPDTVEGISMVGAKTRAFLYGECKENESATRMVHDGRHKLIWYPADNHLQLFDLEKDPSELLNLHGSEPYAEVESKLIDLLVDNAWGTDSQWIRDRKLVGFPFVPSPPAGDRHFGGQRGLHYPQPPLDDPARSVGSPG